MSTNYLSFVPHHVALEILENLEHLPLGVDRRFEAVTLFADVSGFTAISEALGKSGKIGTEELTQILNSYFEPMIVLIKSYGGIIGKFGGDAMTVLFPYDPDDAANMRDVVRRALRCALQMQEDMVNYTDIQTSQGIYGLAMKAGLAMGTIFTTTTGNPDIRLEFIIAGEPIDLCSDAEHHATKGDVVAHAMLLAYAPDAVISEQREDFSLVTALTEPVTTDPIIPPGLVPADAAEVFSRFLHPVIAERLQAEQTEFIDEHRRTTVLFVSFTGFDYDNDPGVAAKLQAYTDAIVNIVYRYGGYLNKIDMGDKGSKYIVLFGTPVAHENDEERALRCALELSEVVIPGMGRVLTRIGVNSGQVYCGRVGAPQRQEYTVMGDAVNLSARLMQFAGPGQIISSELTRDYLPDDGFVWQEMDAITVKGKTEPIKIARLQAVSAKRAVALHEPRYALPMVGRQQELARIGELLEETTTGTGQVIGIQAEAGMGKSRLNAEVIRVAIERGFVGYGGACQSYNTALSYVVWQGMWQGFFGIDPAADKDVQLETLRAAVQDLSEDFMIRFPLLGPVVDLNISDNDFTAPLDATLRADLLYTLLLRCLRLRSAEHPLLLVLEDVHWIDDDSRDLLTFLARNVIDLPVMIVALFRPPYAQEKTPITALLEHLPNYTGIILGEFDEQEAAQLIRLKMEQLFDQTTAISSAFVGRMTQRAQGNPFYIEEFINLLHDRNITPDDMARIEEFDLPENLQQLILSRIDGLAEDEKVVIKVASIIGRVFRASWVYGSYPEVGVPQFVIQRLDRLGDLELTPLDRPEPELEYLFRHLLTQEVAYGTMAFSVRGDLHERVADFVEGRYQENLPRYYDVIAYHYGQTENTDKQRTYFRLAGDNAKVGYALKAATYYYERLLPLLTDATERAPVLLALGEALRITGDWDRAEALFREAITATGDDLLRARTQTALGDLLSFREGYREAITLLEQALLTFNANDDQGGAATALKHLSFAHLRLGDYDAARTTGERQLSAAGDAHDRVATSEARLNLGMVDWFTGQMQTALDVFEQVRAESQDAGYLQGVIYAGSNIGGIHYGRGDYPAAMQALQNAMNTAREVGYVRALGAMTSNMGSLYEMAEHHEATNACYQSALETGLMLGDWTLVANALGNLAGAFVEQAAYADVERVCARAIPLARLLESPHDLALALLSRATMLHERGLTADAHPLAEEAITVGTAYQHPQVPFRANVLMIVIRFALEELDTEGVTSALDALRETFSDEEQLADLDYTLWLLHPDNADAQRDAANRYYALYEALPRLKFRRRYQELTGDDLPEAPRLPDLPAHMVYDATRMEALLARVDARLS